MVEIKFDDGERHERLCCDADYVGDGESSRAMLQHPASVITAVRTMLGKSVDNRHVRIMQVILTRCNLHINKAHYTQIKDRGCWLSQKV